MPPQSQQPHLALARKWRPGAFSEMVGQEHVLKALVNALEQQRLHHAYLFTGTRGVGKTTVARILAKCLNCTGADGKADGKISAEPCGECPSCMEIADGRSLDLIEVDAASRTKVDETRELLENVQQMPARDRFKVYLIDEVHMFSKHSFNALLKTLEEPPEYAKFLLATTEPKKLPATVLSRCLQFNLKHMAPELIKEHLAKVLQAEKIEHDEAALWLLARAADGSMRDALSLADQGIAFGSGALKEAEVRAMLGTVEAGRIHGILEAVAAGDAASALKLIAAMADYAPDYAGGLDEMASLLHRVAVTQAVPGAADASWGDAEQVAALAAKMTAEDAQLYYQLALNGRRDLALAAEPRGGFEMCVLRMIAFRPAAALAAGAASPSTSAEESAAPKTATGEGAEEVAAPAKKPEAVDDAPKAADTAAQSAAPSPASTPTPAPPPTVPPVPPPAPATAAAGNPPTDNPLQPARWPALVGALQLNGLLQNVAAHTELRGANGDCAHLVLDEANAALYNDAYAERIGAALSSHLGRRIEVRLEIGAPSGETPAAIARRLDDERRAAAAAAAEADPKVRLLMERFDGTLDRVAPLPPPPPIAAEAHGDLQPPG